MQQAIGKQSIAFEKPPTIEVYASIAGKKEGEGPLGRGFDYIEEDDYFGADTWEGAESALQTRLLAKVMEKGKVKAKDIRYVFAGDLLGQDIATSFGVMDFQIPLFGIYGACSTAGEALGLGAMTVAAGYAKKVACLTSSHFASAERQFRYPLEYAGQRPVSATWTVTGGGAYLLSDNPGKIKITGITTGCIYDYGVKDSMNMGAAMAPAAAALIKANLSDFNRSPGDYDRIVTGDLGLVGKTLLLELLQRDGIAIEKQHEDCGIMIFDNEKQETGSGGSGCGCAASTLAAHFLPKIESGEYKRILFVPTGALLSPVSFNEGNSVPGIAHGVVIETAEEL
ncbi:MAG: stage V sporulation protein AD [Lachnospiraceae bacterium]|jgi:stage V sporulation protein AD|nr:stage V sporulation protein AD [Lachnospiraceae bacterium]